MDSFRALLPDFKREVDLEHLERVREYPCVVPSCWAFGEPHHLVSRGAGGSDLGTIPLCRQHHTEIHSMGISAFETKHLCNVWRSAAELIAETLRAERREREGS